AEWKNAARRSLAPPAKGRFRASPNFTLCLAVVAHFTAAGEAPAMAGTARLAVQIFPNKLDPHRTSQREVPTWRLPGYVSGEPTPPARGYIII
ncbi:MAG TPA: hypothetical protein VHH73_12205, partial [Verrucomicrobiae bacterium]|nr:hypothetical protein [Verrucomicrobiae bacterium]